MSFLSRAKKREIYLALDVSPHTVGVIFFDRKEDSNIPRIIFSHREYIGYHRKPTLATIKSKVKNTLNGLVHDHAIPLLRQLNAESPTVISDAWCIHSLLWSHEESKKIVIKNSEPRVITEAFINEVLAKEFQKIHHNHMHGEYRLVAKNVAKILLNGYFVENPWGKSAHEVSTFVSQSFVSEAMITLVDQIAGFLCARPIIHRGEGEMFLRSLALSIPEASNSIIAYIGGETTDLLRVENGHIMSSISFPRGVSNIVRDMAVATHGEIEISWSHLAQHIAKHRILSKKEMSMYQNSVAEYNLDLSKSLKELSNAESSTNSVILLSAPHHHPIVSSFAHFDGNVVIPFVAKSHDSLVEYDTGVDRDPLFGLIALFANQLVG